MKRIGGRYRLGELIGRGGAAEVFRAFDERLERFVAVKLLLPHVHASERERFAREIRALARLAHPGVVPIYDLGEEEGRLYFVMELVEGGPFDRLGPFEEGVEGRQLLRAALEVLDTLDHLHARGILHRDLTPANILTTPEGHAKVMDFGLAYLAGSEGLTRTGYTLGTPLYMAPEQATGGELTPAADLYAFGAVLYKALTGEPPFTGEHDQAILYKHVYEEPAPPEAKNPAVFPLLAGLVRDLLAKRPEDRPRSARVAHRRLRRAVRELEARAYRTARAGASRSGHYPEGPLAPETLRQELLVQLEGEPTWPGEIVAQGERLALGVGARGLALVEEREARYLPADDEVSAPPLFADALYYAGWDGGIYRHEGSGVERLSLAQAEITAAPLEAGGRIFVPGRDGRLYALEGGRLAYAFEAEGHLAAGATLYRGLLLLPSESEAGWLYVLEPASGRLLYKVEVGPILVPVPAAEGVVLLPTWPGEVHAFDPLRRETLWSFELEGEVWAPPAVGYGMAFLVSWGGVLYAVDLQTGDEVWRTEVGRVTAGLSLAAGVLYVATEEGRFYAFDAKSGEVRFEAGGLGELQIPPLPTERGVYLAALDGRFYRFFEPE